ncbi:hypothetical protein [Kangiella marina]
MKNVVNPKKNRAEHDGEEIFLDICQALIVVLLLGVVGYAIFS